MNCRLLRFVTLAYLLLPGAGFSAVPGKAILVSPSGSIATNAPLYTWNAVADSTWYYLWVNDTVGTRIQSWYTASQAGCASGTGTCAVTPSMGLATGTAQWWIQTWNDSGYGPWSDGMQFVVTGAGLPGKATLLSPSGPVTTTTPTYIWNALPTATWYYLWVNDTTGTRIQIWYTASQAACGSGTGTCVVTPASALALGAAQWWIQAWNDHGYGLWSDAMSVTVQSGPVITPLLSKTVTGITAIAGDPDVGWSESLLPGSLISGTISGAGQGLQVIASSGGNNIYTGQINPLTGRYLLVVPDGSYSLKVCYQPSGVPNTLTVTVTYTDPNPVQVVFNGVRDITLPSVTVFDVTGTVTGLSSLPSGGNATIVFTTGDNGMQGQFALDGGGNYQGVLPAGSYRASVISGSLQLYNLGSLTVQGGPATGNYAIPATAKLSGTIRGGGQVTISSGTNVTAADSSAPVANQSACCAAPAVSSAAADASGQYQMVLAQGRSFEVGVTVPLMPGTSTSALVSYPVSSSAVSMAGDVTLDFNIPAILRRVQIFGNVNDGMGHVLADVIVTAYSQSLTGAANASFSASTKTDIYGNYAIIVAGGTNYQLTFEPPVPKP